MGFPIFQSLERGKDIPQPIEIDIGKCLRFCRSVYCLTQKDVADQIGVPLQTLRQYEQGKGHIPCYMLWTLSNFLRVPVARFFEFEQAAQHDHNNFFWCEDEVLSGEDDEEEEDDDLDLFLLLRLDLFSSSLISFISISESESLLLRF